jgi:hypothetical protein
MVRNRLFVGSGLSCWLLVASTACLQAQDRVQVEPGRRAEVARAGGARRVSNILGAKVTIQNNVSIGKVEDLIINDNGTIDYMVVLNEDKYVLVPWNAGIVDFDQRTIAVEIPREKFREVPTFTRERWPDLNDRVYVEKLHGYYGVRQGRERRIERREDRKRP